MAEGGGEFGYKDPKLDKKIDNDSFGWDDDWDNDQHEVNILPTFEPPKASTPYNGGEKIEMQTVQHEQSGLPSYDESTPLLSTSDIERRFRALRTDPLTGIIDTTQMDASINPLSEEDREKQIERVKKLIKANYPYAKVDSLVIRFSEKKNSNGYCGFGAKGW